MGSRLDQRGLRVLAVALLCLEVLVVVSANPKSAEAAGGALSSSPVLVSMGDSFASGEANPPFDKGTNDVPLYPLPGRKNLCHRSPASAARLLGATATTQIACSGAVIDDVVSRGKWSTGAPDNRSQIEQLKDLSKSQAIDGVTISIGGNDLDFGGVVTKCFIQITGGCLGDLDERLRAVDAVTSRLRDVVYPAIRQAVGAQIPILVVGYPRLFPTNDRAAVRCGWLSDEERRRANELQNRFDASTAAAVRDSTAQNIKYVSMLDTSSGHELCTQDSWFYPVSTVCNPGQFETGVKAYCAHPLARLQYTMALRLSGWTPRKFDASRLGCGIGCQVTGQIMLRHPTWGWVILLTTVHKDSSGLPRNAMLVVVDRNDRVRYRSRTFEDIARQPAYGITAKSFGPVQSFPDTARSQDDGNLFIAYNPGRYNGIITLRPTATGFEDLGSIPKQGDYAARNYHALVVNAKRTAVVIQRYVCYEPACSIPEIRQWNGSNYVAVPKDLNTRSCRPMVSDGLNGAWIYKATIGCDVVAWLVMNRRYAADQWYQSDGFICISWRNEFGGPDGGTYFQCASGARYVTFQYI